MTSLKLFSGTGNLRLAEDTAKVMNLQLSHLEIKKFKDTEIYVKVRDTVRGDDVFIIQPTSAPVNDNLMELLIIIDAMKRASAGRINVVMPYFGYARQDRKASAREPISAKLVANLITVAGASRVIAIDLHSDQLQGFFDIPVDHFACYPLFATYLKKKNLSDMVVVSSDTGFAKKAKRLAKLMNLPLAIIDKRRPEHEKVEVVFVVGDVRDKTAILVDDLIDTGGTIAAGADSLMKMGAKEVYICATHGVLSADASAKLENSAAKEVILSDTVVIPKEKMIRKLSIVTVAPMLSQIIQRVHENRSLGELFNWEE